MKTAMTETKQLLRAQLELLAEASRRSSISADDLCKLSGVMVAVAKEHNAHCFTQINLDQARQPDRYAIQTVQGKPSQGD